MKNIMTFILALFASTSMMAQGYFTGTLDNTGNSLSFTLMVNSSDITDGFTSIGITLRVADGQEPFEWGEITPNVTDFPNLEINQVLNPFGSEDGFTSYLFSFSDLAGTTSNTYLVGQEYELFSVDLVGDQLETVNIQASHNEFEDVDQFYIVAGGDSYTDPAFSTYFYGADATNSYVNTDGATVWTVEKQNVALPITLKSFTARAIDNKDAHLDWNTATEINSSHFEIERSEDGVNFEYLAKVDAVGNSATVQTYSYIDRDVNQDREDIVRYYRLKLVDIDGEYKYSGIRVVNFTREAIDFSLEVFPNPTNDFVQIEITGIDNTSTERPMLEVYNNTGALVRSIELDSDLGRIDMTDMPSMLYHFMISYDGQRYPLRVMKID